MRTNLLSNKGFLLHLYNGIVNVVIFGYIKSIKEGLEQKDNNNGSEVVR